MKTVCYKYKNMPIGGGGYVTGIEFDRNRPDLLYARTDIGGVYRFDRENSRWISLMDKVSQEDLSESYPSEILSADGVLYMTCGCYDKNCRLCVSYDFGETFSCFSIPARIHGNSSGRGTGNRLAVLGNVIYYASAEDGLLKSSDGGKTWAECSTGGERHMTLVMAYKDGTVIAGTAGADTLTGGRLRGKSLYVSYDGGESFELMPQPGNFDTDDSLMPGLVAHRITAEGENVYVTMNMTGKCGWKIPLSYSCDAGGIIGGTVLKYTRGKNGRFSSYENITPPCDGELTKSGLYPYGFGGICAENGMLAAATICKDSELIYLSCDGGKTWNTIVEKLRGISFSTPYMKPECNENGSLIHWMSDIKINPHNRDEAWFNTGTGIFRTDNLTDSQPVFSDCCCGMEETVHLNVYSTASGKVKVIDILGDLGGFAFEDRDRHCPNTFSDEKNRRFITCMNADFPDKNPEIVLASARGNWNGTTKGGVIVSRDGGCTFSHPQLPFGLSEKIDRSLERISRPNMNSGWVSVSADGKKAVWCIADERNQLPADCVVYSDDLCESYKKSVVLISEGTAFEGNIKVFSDRVHPGVFYGFGNGGEFFVSSDGGAVFSQLYSGLPETDFTKIDAGNKTDIKPDSGRSGVFYITADDGLYKLTFDGEKAKTKKLSSESSRIFRVGLGISKDSDYLNSDKVLYVYGVIEGKYGFYRMDSNGENIVRISSDRQLFGEINAVEGDSREYGVFYIGSGSRGLLYGRPE
ncbi:MAG: hypothetical protein ACI4I9_04235 [Porcipelethomonas sp.]